MATDAVARTMANDALALAQKAASVEQNVVFAEDMTAFNATAATMITSITELNIPDGVTTISQPTYDADEERYGKSRFEPYTNLKKITIPGSVKTVNGYTFYGCSQIQEVCMKDGVEEIGDSSVFSSCTSLKSVSLPETLLSIGYGAFYECTALTEITIPSSVTTIKETAFSQCKNLKITISKPEGSISGSPWGATNATVVWTG